MFKNRVRERPYKQEQEVAESLGGKRVPASGAMPHMPGDVRTEDYLVDAKHTESSFTLSAQVLDKISKEAARGGRVPVIHVELVKLPPNRREWAIIPWSEFESLLEKK